MSGRRLEMLQALPLGLKVEMAKIRIRKFVEWAGGINKVYICFSGGKDSTVLAHIANEIYPGIKMVFSDTGLEFPEIKEFVQEKKDEGWDIEVVRPKKNFLEIIDYYGYPVISKETSMAISRWRNTKFLKQKHYRMNGRVVNGKKQVVGVIPKKYQQLAIDNKFKISEKCCEYIKKEPLKTYEKKTGRKPILGTMAGESRMRTVMWNKYGCNALDNKAPYSAPLSIWNDDDIWAYIKEHNLEVAKPYSMGYHRTGCIWCAYGIMLEGKNGELNRFQMLKKTHYPLWKYVIYKLGYKLVLEELGVEYE